MSSVLEEICNVKRAHVAAQKDRISESELLQHANSQEAPRGFIKALKAKAAHKQTALIAEVKKASPSKGIIRADFNASDIAVQYDRAGATCISVLTDEPYFQGKDEYLGQVKQSVKLPLLRKDFMVDTYQITESRALGADAILIIMAALSDAQAMEIEATAHALGMDALIEVHDAAELERAKKHLKSPLIGINNRNLKTLKVDMATTSALLPMLPTNSIGVCESGIKSHADIQHIEAQGIYCFLVGESLMLEPDIERATRLLIGE
jgi:indole-3-glycerol phosphate synthase